MGILKDNRRYYAKKWGLASVELEHNGMTALRLCSGR